MIIKLAKRFFSCLTVHYTDNPPGMEARVEARWDARPPGMRTVAGSIPTFGKTFFRSDLVMKKFYDHSLPSADLRRAVVTNGHQVLVNCLGSLPRNSVAKLTDRARNDLKCKMCRRAVKHQYNQPTNSDNPSGKPTEPAHEIMALFVLGKFILQMHMRSHPVGLNV